MVIRLGRILTEQTYTLNQERQKDQWMTSYRDIADRVADDILQQELEQGSRLPSVRDLAAQHGVSAKTAHAAIRELQARGLVRSYRGGTIVSPFQSIPTPAERLERTLAGAGALRPLERAHVTYAGWAGPEVDSEDWHVTHVHQDVYDVLKLPQDVALGRREYVIYQRKKLISLTVSWHPPKIVDLVPALLAAEPITEGTVAALAAAGVRFAPEDQTHLTARRATEREARLMGTAVDDPVLAAVSLREDSDGTPVEYVETVYRELEILSFNL
jgi:DNA-binding GntR family transcriptional regulator